jgi:hypothetical protein
VLLSTVLLIEKLIVELGVLLAGTSVIDEEAILSVFESVVLAVTVAVFVIVVVASESTSAVIKSVDDAPGARGPTVHTPEVAL